jgi:hypothetical protein
MSNKLSIFGFTLKALQTKLIALGLKKHNAQQIFQ